jgi:hypothetical protein
LAKFVVRPTSHVVRKGVDQAAFRVQGSFVALGVAARRLRAPQDDNG